MGIAFTIGQHGLGTLGYDKAGFDQWINPETAQSVDAFSKVYTIGRFLSEAISNLDSIVKKPAISKGDSFQSIDALTRSVSKLLNEVLTVAQSFQGTPTKKFSIGYHGTDTIRYDYAGFDQWVNPETVSVASSVTNFLTAVKMLNETLAVASSLVKNITVPRSEAFALADTRVNAPNKIVSEAFSGVDSLTKAVTTNRNESYATIEALAKFISVPKNEAFTVIDSVVKSLVKVFSEILALLTSLVTTPTKKFSIGNHGLDVIKYDFAGYDQWINPETPNFADSFAKVLTQVRTFSEAVAVLDAVAKAASVTKNDSVQSIDSIKKSFARILTDILSLMDALLTTPNKRFVLGGHGLNAMGFDNSGFDNWVDPEMFNLVEVYTKLLTFVRAYAETFTVTDSRGPSAIAIKKFDAVLVQITGFNGSEHNMNETPHFADTMLRNPNKRFNLGGHGTDALGFDNSGFDNWVDPELPHMSDSFVRVLNYIKGLNELYNVLDSSAKYFTFVKNEAVHLVDSLVKANAKTLLENFLVSTTLLARPNENLILGMHGLDTIAFDRAGYDNWAEEFIHLADTSSRSAGLHRTFFEAFRSEEAFTHSSTFQLALYRLDLREYFRFSCSDKTLEDFRKYATMVSVGQMDVREASRLLFGDRL